MNQKTFLLTAICLQLVFCVAVALNIVIVRQVVGLLFLTFLPGLLIVRMLGLDNDRGITDVILFSFGFGLVFDMIIGLTLNTTATTFGLSNPLSLFPSMVTFNGVILLLVLRDFFSRRQNWTQTFNFTVQPLGLIGLFTVPLILSIIGAMLVNNFPYNENYVLLLMISAISILLMIIAFSNKRVPPLFYALIIFILAVSLLFHFSLVSNLIHGGDIFVEYYDFKLTESVGYWNILLSGKTYAMLSVTILPTIYGTNLGISGETIFKIVFPLILAFVPLGLYQLYRKRSDEKIALFSVFFFISNSVFFTEIASLARQMVGEFFYVLLFLVLFSNNMNRTSKSVSFILFSFGLVVSHYAMSYFFLASIILLWIVSFMRKQRGKMTLPMVAIFVVLCFLWYAYVSGGSTLNSLFSFGDYVLRNLTTDFLNPGSRGSQVLQGIGLAGVETFWHLIGRYLSYLTEALIVVGFVTLVIQKKRAFWSDEFNLLILLNLILVFMAIVLPNFATSFNMSRLYQVTLFFLSPMCALGIQDGLKLVFRKTDTRRLSLFVLLLVMIPFFLFQTGFVYEIAGDVTWSLPLSRYRLSSDVLYISMGIVENTEYNGAKWLGEYVHPTATQIFSDWTSNRIIMAYGNHTNFEALANTTVIPANSFVFLNEFNTETGEVFTDSGKFNLSNSLLDLSQINVAYSNGGCDIYSNQANR